MEHTQEFYQQLAQVFNRLVKEKGKKKAELADAYLEVAGEDAPFFTRHTSTVNVSDREAHTAFVTAFIQSIGDTRLAVPLLVYTDDPIILAPKPVAPRRGKKGVVGLKDCVDPKKYDVVLIEDGYVVATNDRAVVRVPDNSLPAYEGETLPYDRAVALAAGETIPETALEAGRFPNYRNVTPEKTIAGAVMPIDDLLDYANGAVIMFGNILFPANIIRIEVLGAVICLHPALLRDTLKALKANSAKQIELCQESVRDYLSIYCDNGAFALIAPCTQGDSMRGYAFTEVFQTPKDTATATALIEKLKCEGDRGLKSYEEELKHRSENPDDDPIYVKLASLFGERLARLEDLLAYTPEATEPDEAPTIIARNILAIDIETYSPVDIKKSGVYPYAAHPDFEVLLFAYAFDDEPVRVVDLASGETLPGEVRRALTDPDIRKVAYNAPFERACLARHLGEEMPAEQWECTMVGAAMQGWPLGLDAVAKAMNLEQEKMAIGKALIRYFCVPCKPTKTNGLRVRNTPQDDPERWELFKEYCGKDVEVEREVRRKLAAPEISDSERALWVLDQKINDRGIAIDTVMVENAITIDETYRAELNISAAEITGLDNPNSAAQLKAWLSEQTGEEVESLTKEAIKGMLEGEHSDEVLQALRLRQEMAKTSVKKYETMHSAVGADGRIRGLLQYYGANRTGRWAGRLVQVQNLPQNHLEDLDVARSLVVAGDGESLDMFYGNVPDTLSQLIRTAFIADPATSSRFIVADFSAIEARVIAWVAGEQWRQDVFATHGKIYEASAAAMFSVPIESVVKGSPLRQKGKIAELALGYQGGVGALKAMGALGMGLHEEELPGLVNAWRLANRAIVRLWDDVNAAAMEAIENRTSIRIQHGITFSLRQGALYITLPSGRHLVYQSAGIGTNRFGGKSITYWGMDQTTKKWSEQETYGGKLVENIVQAIARDCLAVALLRLDAAGYPVVMHIHDEAVIEAQEGNTLQKACELMGQPIDWAPGLLLRADGYETSYYKKD